MVNRATRILIMAGGTGGHVFPALAVAEQLRKQGVEVVWLGTQRGLEATVVPEAAFPIEYISVSGLRGKGLQSWLWAPFKLIYAVSQAFMLLLKQRPDAVLGLGGFVTGPGGVASWLQRRPLLIHEQNAIPGFTNRILSHLARCVMEAFPGSFAASVSALHTGNPVRQGIMELVEPEKRFKQRQGNLRVLVIGGSLGAQALNETLPKALALLPAEHRPDIWHQTGKTKLDDTRQHYAAAQVDARVVAFIDDMAEAYAWADLVICRAGALTISELAAAGVASVLIPFPYAVDDHQTQNAQYLVKANAAIVIQQSELTAEKLATVLKELLSKGRTHLLSMAQNARGMAMPNATQHVAGKCLEVAHA